MFRLLVQIAKLLINILICLISEEFSYFWWYIQLDKSEIPLQHRPGPETCKCSGNKAIAKITVLVDISLIIVL